MAKRERQENTADMRKLIAKTIKMWSSLSESEKDYVESRACPHPEMTHVECTVRMMSAIGHDVIMDRMLMIDELTRRIG